MKLDVKIKPIMNGIFLLEDEIKVLLSEEVPEKIKLTAVEERILFLQYNYIRYRALLSQNNIKKNFDMVENETDLRLLYNSMRKCEDRLIKANMGLVASAISSLYNFDKDEVESDCTLALLFAIRTFDVERGKFSTWGYANIQLSIKKFITLKKKNKEIACENKHFDDIEVPITDISSIEAIREIVDENMADLTPSELQVIRMRYFSEDKPNHIIIGTRLGFSKEWSRKIEKEGLLKLRKTLEKTR